MKIKTALYIALIMSCLCFAVMLGQAQAASMTFGESNDIEGGLHLLDGCIKWADNTLTCTNPSDTSAVWGEITGIIQNQQDLQSALDLKASINPSDRKLKTEHIPIMTYDAVWSVPVNATNLAWQSQGLTWVEIPEYGFQFTTFNNIMTTDIYLSENIGIQGSSWCNLGVFIDDNVNPVCSWSFSGNPYAMVFQSQTLFCSLGRLTSNNHHLHIKHRSQNCVYGNYWDEQSIQRQILLREHY